MQNPHIVKAFDQELDLLTSKIDAMGEFAGTQFTNAVLSLLQGDVSLAQQVADQDRRLDDLRRELSASAAMTITRRQPMAGDLDEVLVDFKIVEDLERIGDLAKNIAKRASAMAGTTFPTELSQGIQKLAGLASAQLERALATFASRDAEEALVVREADEAIDELHTAVFRDLVEHLDREKANTIGYVHLLFCAKNIERIGDHATHIAEAAYLKAMGTRPESERRRLDASSTSIGPDDSWRSS